MMKNDLFTISVPAKIILLGEHAVVYGQPAVAMPVLDVCCHGTIEIKSTKEKATITATDLNVSYSPGAKNPPSSIQHIQNAILFFQDKMKIMIPQTGWALTIRSDIPVGRGMGSSAAVSVLMIRVLARLTNMQIRDEDVSGDAYELEKYHHGTPSGIDNTVVSLAQPVFFQKGRQIETLQPAQFYFVIGDTGIGKHTGTVVAEVARRYEQNPQQYNQIFTRIGELARAGRSALERGDQHTLADSMNENQLLLQAIGVSSMHLESLIKAAMDAGAHAAKLCGAGQGGCMIALATDNANARHVQDGLITAGAAKTFITTLKPGKR